MERHRRHVTMEASPPSPPEYRPRTELGKRLWELRQEIVAARDLELLDWDGVERELAERRGESKG